MEEFYYYFYYYFFIIFSFLFCKFASYVPSFHKMQQQKQLAPCHFFVKVTVHGLSPFTATATFFCSSPVPVIPYHLPIVWVQEPTSFETQWSHTADICAYPKSYGWVEVQWNQK